MKGSFWMIYHDTKVCRSANQSLPYLWSSKRAGSNVEMQPPHSSNYWKPFWGICCKSLASPWL